MHPLLRSINRESLTRAWVSGSSASVLSALTAAWCGKRERNSAASGLNGPSQWIWGERAARTRRASLEHTLLGYLIHHGTSTLWAFCYERLFSKPSHKSTLRILAEAATLTAAAYVVDYKLTPRRLRPGFEKHVGPGAMFTIYTSFCLGLAATTLLRRARRESRGT